MLEALWLLLKTAGSLLATACVLRAYAARVRLSANNPIMQFVIALTDWLVLPIRRILPAGRSIDWASLLAALLIAVVVGAAFVLLFRLGHPPSFGAVVLLAVFWLIEWSLYLLMFLVILQAILSWVNPAAPVAPVVDALTRPFLAPLRRIVPLIGGVDLSPLVLIVLVQVVLTLLGSLLTPFLRIAG